MNASRALLNGLLVGMCLCWAADAHAYVPDSRWSVTASGSTGVSGSPAKLTWSFAPDGTYIPGEGSSDLISYLDDVFNVTSTSGGLTQRPWFTLFDQAFDRWSEVSGLTFAYEPNDTGSSLQTSSGRLGTRGDIRIGGSFIDGAGSTLAYAWLPNIGDVVIDTGETSYYGNASGNYQRLRNTVMHEVGHALGLLHVESSTDVLLMEPVINLSIDGPQLDDIRGIQGYYGDVYEKSNGGLGNGTYTRATSLGRMSLGGELSVGTDAIGGQSVAPGDIDFVSIANASDIDFFSFTIDAPAVVDFALTPRGGVFNQGAEGEPQSQFNANARNDLQLAIYDTNGTSLLASANQTGLGGAEQIAGLALDTAGTYYARVRGSSDNVQLYDLLLSSTALLLADSGDFNGDGRVDLADYTVWRDSLGATGLGLAADGNHDRVVNAADYNIWRNQLGSLSSSASVIAANVPEPPTALILALGIISAAACVVRKRAPTT